MDARPYTVWLNLGNKNTGALRLRRFLLAGSPGENSCVGRTFLSDLRGVGTLAHDHFRPREGTALAVPFRRLLLFLRRIVRLAYDLRIESLGRTRTSDPHTPYALLRGLIVKSRTCVRMLDICIPFSCETNGIISAMNGSFINSTISS